jgi:glutathione S-transferase
MKIYGDVRSGNCDKVRFTVDYLGISYEWIEVDSVSGKTRTQEFLARNPQGQVPTVEFDDGRFLSQSNAIVRRLADGTALLPSDPWIKAQIDEWMFWESNNHEFFLAGCIGHMTYMGKSRETRDAMRVERGERALRILDQHLSQREWLVGDTITVADIALLAYTRQAHLGGFDMSGKQGVRSWIARSETALSLLPT